MEVILLKYLCDVKWEELRPTKEESEAGLYGVRADQSGVRIEVRILNTVEHGRHVEAVVCDKNHLLKICERIRLPPGTAQHQRFFEEGKRRAVMLADRWLEMVL